MFYSFVGIIISSIICMVSALAPCSTSNNEITYFNNIMSVIVNYTTEGNVRYLLYNKHHLVNIKKIRN